MMKFLNIIIISLFLLGYSSCGLYKMPDDEDVSVSPLTNSPSLTRNKKEAIMPGVEY